MHILKSNKFKQFPIRQVNKKIVIIIIIMIMIIINK